MRIIKLAFISFIVLFVLITLFSLLFPSHIRISRAVNMPNSPERIFSLVKQDSLWHPAYLDTATFKNYTALQKTLIEESDSAYVLQLKQRDKKPVISGWQLHGTAAHDSLVLQWYMDFNLSWYPWEKFSSMFYEKTYGVMMEAGLENLKNHLK